MLRFGMLAALLLLVVATSVMARGTSLSRREIRSMPITERPSRPGHFYGNAVRRNNYRGADSGRAYAAPSNAWQGYSAPAQSNAWSQGQTSEVIITD